MLKSNKYFKIFITTMIFVLAGLLLATGIIAVQKNLEIKLEYEPEPLCLVQVEIKDANDTDFTTIFQNNEETMFVHEGVNISQNGALHLGFSSDYINTLVAPVTIKVTNYSLGKVFAEINNENNDNISFLVESSGAFYHPMNSQTVTLSSVHGFSIELSLVVFVSLDDNISFLSLTVHNIEFCLSSSMKQGYIKIHETLKIQYTYEIEVSLGETVDSAYRLLKYLDFTMVIDSSGFRFSERLNDENCRYMSLEQQGNYYYLNENVGKEILYDMYTSNPMGSFRFLHACTNINEPELSQDDYEPGIHVGKKGVSDWSVAAPVLEGVKIQYFSRASAERITLSLSDLTLTTQGKQNATNNFWEYKGIDFTLKVTNSSYIHSSKSKYGMPVVAGANKETLKLYFVISSEDGFVSSSTASRAIYIEYEFTDFFGNVLTFDHTWSINKPESGAEIYDYAQFCNGTLELIEYSTTTCITPDTLITLSDGSQKRVDQLTGNEQLLVWNMRTGRFDSAPIMFIDSDPEYEFNIIKLTFSDNTEVKVIYEHGFWDYDLNKYVYFLEDNCFDYIGHTFAKQNGDELEQVELINVEIEKILTTAWSPITVEHLGYFVNGMLSMPGGTNSFVNMFEFDTENMIYDFEKMEEDIATYGLFTYEELNEICPLPEELFYGAGAQYLKVSIAKGLMTLEELIYKINKFRDYV